MLPLRAGPARVSEYSASMRLHERTNNVSVPTASVVVAAGSSNLPPVVLNTVSAARVPSRLPCAMYQVGDCEPSPRASA